MQKLLPENKRMPERGMSQGEAAERLGLKGDRPIHDLLKRERKKAMQVTPPTERAKTRFQLTKQYGITPSMSRRGNPYDNAMAENFFSILKTECIYRHKPATFSEASKMIDRYIHVYNHERIQFKTGEAPLARRLSC